MSILQIKFRINTNMPQYWSQNDFIEKINNNLDYENIKFYKTDTYNEDKIMLTINKGDIQLLFQVALQCSIIGYGNKVYGKIIYNENEYDLKELMDNNGILYDNNPNDKLLEDALTLNRLVRFFRFGIQNYIDQNKDCYSYLYKKYCLNKEESLRIMIFRGSEYLIPIDNEKSNYYCEELLKCYKEIDIRFHTNITEKIKRILIGRGFSSIYINNLK